MEDGSLTRCCGLDSQALGEEIAPVLWPPEPGGGGLGVGGLAMVVGNGRKKLVKAHPEHLAIDSSTGQVRKALTHEVAKGCLLMLPPIDDGRWVYPLGCEQIEESALKCSGSCASHDGSPCC